MTDKTDPMRGVVKPEALIEALKKRDASYVRGALQWLTRHPPNKHIVPLLQKALERFKHGRSTR